MNFLILMLSTVVWAAPNYIVGGQEVAEPDPIQQSTVGIFGPSSDGRSGSLCTGTVIRNNMVLTAAHCIPQGGTKPVVIFGSDLHAPMAPHRQVDGVAVNPKWRTEAGKGMDQGDIALVKFRGPLPEGYKKVSVVRSEREIHAGDHVTLAGYGINDARLKSGAGRLRKTEVQVLKNRAGKSEMILDQSHGRGACHGDSGGPAFITSRGGKIKLAGVTNRGYPNRAPDDCAHQSVYTKVPSYRSWIASSEKKLEEGPSLPSLARNERRQTGTVMSKTTHLLRRSEMNRKMASRPKPRGKRRRAR